MLSLFTPNCCLGISKPKLRELSVRLSIISKESIFIRSIFVNKRTEHRVRQKSLVSWQLKETFLLTGQQLSEVCVVEDVRVGSPGSLKSRALLVCSSKGVATRESNNVHIIKSHGFDKHIPQMVRTLSCIGQATLRWWLRLVLSARVERNVRSTSDLNSDNTGQLVEISIGQDGKLLLKRLQQPHSDVKTIVSTVSELSSVLHGSEGTTSLGLHIKGPSRVPCQTEHKRSAFLVSDEASELSPGLLDSLLVISADGRVRLSHGWRFLESEEEDEV
uniref:Uncharacterized protein n=1 Tax=Lotus japonicus TaxID=34305 RepID=I3SD17_LOTJA|nr:unknown [Lotus japonicus]